MVEKMKLLHITGPKNDVDRVMEQYLSRYEIHFENAASGFGISGHVRPFAETNIYKDACTKAQALWEHLKDEPGGAADYAMPVKMEPAEAEKVVEAAYRLTDEDRETAGGSAEGTHGESEPDGSDRTVSAA